MKKAVAAVLMVFGVGLILWHFWGSKPPMQETAGPPATAIAPAPGSNISSSLVPNASTGVSTVIATSALPAVITSSASHDIPPAPAPPEVSSLPPLTVLDNARVAIHNYNGTFGENPVGDNAEITAALRGKNPKQINFITEESGLRVNGQGEMVDAWGTPFFFHQLSAQLMEIRSAGEDKKMWTFDDLVTR